MKKILFIILLFPVIVYSQDFGDKKHYLIDSLYISSLAANDIVLLDTCLKKYHAANSELIKIDALQKVCEKMMHDDWIRYQFYQYDLIKKTNSIQFSDKDQKELLRFEANALNNLGYYFKYQGDIPEAIKKYNESLEIRRKINDKAGMGASYNNIGRLYQNQGNIVEAIKYGYKALNTLEEVGDKIGVGNVYNNLGVLFDDQGDLEKAIEFYKLSLDVMTELKDSNGIAIAVNNIGFVYKKKEDYDKAISYFNNALEIHLKIGNESDAAYTMNNLGQSYKIKGDDELALNYYQKSIVIHEKLGNKSGLALTLNNIGNLMFEQKNVNGALVYADKGFLIANELGSPSSILNSSMLLHNIYLEQKNYLGALKMYKLHLTMRDSLNNESTQKVTAQQEAKYEYEKQKAVDDAEYDKQIAIEQEAKAKQKVITYSIAGGLGLVVIFLVFVFNRLQVTKKQKLVIETQKIEVEQQKEVVELAHFELEEKNQEILDSITYAKRIQNAILPPLKVVKEYLKESFILYKPKDIVAGDFYWMESVSFRHAELDSASPNDDKLVLFAAADCTGHGVPGAMVSVVCNNGLNRAVREFGLTDPGEILNKTREIVIAEFEKSEDEVKDGMDIALCSLEGNTLKYAGSNNPLWIIRKGEILETKANKQPIGQFENPEPYTTHTIELQKGDSIYIFSDGYVDQFGGEKGKKFKAAAFRTLLLSIQTKSMEEQQTIINSAFEDWKGNLEQIDDVCVIGVRI